MNARDLHNAFPAVAADGSATADAARVPQKISPAFSAYLDLVRFCAAMTVLIAHLIEQFPVPFPVPLHGKDAVIAFFVLSGFVVAFVADTKERTPGPFLFSRATRLSSVFVPALILGLLLMPLAGQKNWLSPHVLGPAVGASVVNAFYLGQNWFLDITPPNNNPSWSLNYEAWYYLIFAGAVFARGAWRWPVALFLGACAGPKILILMPCWIAGVWLYRYGNKFTLSNRNAVLLFLASIAAYLVYLALDLNKDIRTELHAHMPALIDSLGWSNRFAGDYLLCGIILANFIAARDMTAIFARTMIRYSTTVKWLAGYTLSIYLFHDPLIAVFGHQLEPLHLGRLEAPIILALLIPSIMLLASVSELQLSRLRKGLRKLFARNAQPHFSAS